MKKPVSLIIIASLLAALAILPPTAAGDGQDAYIEIHTLIIDKKEDFTFNADGLEIPWHVPKEGFTQTALTASLAIRGEYSQVKDAVYTNGYILNILGTSNNNDIPLHTRLPRRKPRHKTQGPRKP